MIIESSTFRIRDDYGLVIEVKPVIEVSADEASREIAIFFSKYRIVMAHKEINPIDKKKLILATPQKEILSEVLESKKIRPAETLSIKQLLHIVKKCLPNEFCRKDFIDYIGTKEEFSGYTIEDKLKMWTSVHAFMKRNKKIALVGKEGCKRDYKYRYIGIDEPKNDTDLKISSLKNGEIVKL